MQSQIDYFVGSSEQNSFLSQFLYHLVVFFVIVLTAEPIFANNVGQVSI